MSANTNKRLVAIVTGASSGIGLGITRALLERGYRVVANSRTISQSRKLKPSADLVLLVEFGIVTNHAAAEIGCDGAGRDDVDGDAARTQFLRQVTGEDLDGTLHGGIRGALRDNDAG